MKKLIYLLGMVSLLFTVPACKKKSSSPATNASSGGGYGYIYTKLYCMDCATTNTGSVKSEAISSIKVDIRRLEIFDAQQGWKDLKLKSGVYDLATLKNDIGMFITDKTELEPASFKYMYIYFGDNNSITVDNTEHCLKLSKKELMINCNAFSKSNVLTELDLNFNVCNAVTRDAGVDNPCYVLSPNISLRSYSDMSL